MEKLAKLFVPALLALGMVAFSCQKPDASGGELAVVTPTPDPEPTPEPEPEPADTVLRDSVGTGLPVIYVRTRGGAAINSKEEYTEASIAIYGGEQYEDLQWASCQIRGRGNTTWHWPKKPYAVKLAEKAPVLGMPKHKRWVLLANFMDRTLMRNIVAYKLGSMTSLDWTPRYVPVELVLNGKHKGNYLLTEQIKADKKRVPIDEKEGFLLELDYHYDNKFQWYDSRGFSYTDMGTKRSGIPFGIKNPDDDELRVDQLAWVKSFIRNAAEAVYEHGDVSEYIDYQSFADYFIVFEMMGNGELSNPGSVYFHFNPDEKIKAGPLWDFDWGTLSFYSHPSSKTSFVNDEGVWYIELLQDTTFRQVLKDRWAALLPEFQTIPDYIESMRAYMAPSADLNFKMWNPAGDTNFNGGNLINGDEKKSYDSAVTGIKNFFTQRLEIVDGLIGQL